MPEAPKVTIFVGICVSNTAPNDSGGIKTALRPGPGIASLLLE